MDKNLPKIFWTSDWHTGDLNCLEYDNRPFSSIQDMEHQLVKRFNSTVKTGDVTYFLGDMGRDVKKVIPQLNGTKVLVPGNHDHLGMYAALQAGFSAVINQGSIVIGTTLITFTHCPLRGVFRENIEGMRGAKPGELWHGESRHQLYSIPDHGGLHLHGHTHSDKKTKILGRQYDVGVMGNNYFPVSISQIQSWAALASRSQDGQEEKSEKDERRA